ncbi:Thioredoxin [Quillaja saponaria]|uniref:Thioredoxin n=1 Tax=Quillaja saponaria TaxID=32244 RepID=A0AAD7PTR6_QUISA|nr:Thioredoxin [Quillaja saponaria]
MAEEGQVISCHTVEAWNEQLQKGNDSKKLIVVDFTASWCGPCRFIAPILAEIAKRTPEVIFVKVDVDELEVVGAKKEELQLKITKHATAAAASVASVASA